MSETVFNISLGTLISIISLNITIIFSIYCYLRKHYIRQVKNLSKKINEIKYNEKKYYRLESKIKKDKKILKIAIVLIYLKQSCNIEKKYFIL